MRDQNATSSMAVLRGAAFLIGNIWLATQITAPSPAVMVGVTRTPCFPLEPARRAFCGHYTPFARDIVTTTPRVD